MAGVITALRPFSGAPPSGYLNVRPTQYGLCRICQPACVMGSRDQKARLPVQTLPEAGCALLREAEEGPTVSEATST
jgi:hypothetical protein